MTKSLFCFKYEKILLMNNVLVLNYDYTPLNLTSFRRGFILVTKGKAEVIKSDDNPISSCYDTYIRPLIIRLLNYIKYSVKSIKPTKNRIYKRDGNKCVYCGSSKNLTIDHVLPRSRGGNNGWLNLATSCITCNLRKGNKTPEEANMTMIKKPFVPKIIEQNHVISEVWEDFKLTFFI